MGQNGLFRDKIQDIMNRKDVKEFRKLYFEARDAGLPVDLRTIDGLHDQLDDALNLAKKQAEGMLSNSAEVQLRGDLNRILDNELKQGNVEAAKSTQQLINDG
jgi:hypothetical protein